MKMYCLNFKGQINKIDCKVVSLFSLFGSSVYVVYDKNCIKILADCLKNLLGTF